MKNCPQCHQRYADDISFCLSDGTPLLAAGTPEEVTVIKPFPIAESPPVSPPSSRRRTFYLLGFLFAGLILLLVIGAALGLFLLHPQIFSTAPIVSKENSNIVAASPLPAPNAEQESLEEQKRKLREEQSALDNSKQKLAEDRRRLEAQKNSLPALTSPAPNSYSVEPTARINFRRGTAQETVSGSIGKRRTFVLRAKSGQTLSANVNSSGNCVFFSNGSPNLYQQTAAGDNSIVLVNNCDAADKFSLTVYIR